MNTTTSVPKNNDFPAQLRCGGLVLCGGESRRMGVSKADLPFGEETMLSRVVRILSSATQPIVVVAAASQQLPELPDDVLIARDEQPGRGPLQGLAAGLAKLEGRVDAVYATSCDAPFLSSAFILEIIRRLGEPTETDANGADFEIAVPRDGKFHHPLAAVYRASVLREIRRLLAEDRLRPAFLFDAVRTARIPVDELRRVDPELRSLENINQPEDYLKALEQAGFTPPPATLRAMELAVSGSTKTRPNSDKNQ